MFDDKAQMYTLEGISAAAIMFLILLYAIDATSLTPLTSSTANVHVESELQLLGQDILSALDYTEPGYDSRLKSDVSNWTGYTYVWNGRSYIDPLNLSRANLSNNLTRVFEKVLVKQGIAHNVELTYLASDGVNQTYLVSSDMINNGDPSDNAIIVSRKIVLHNNNINETNLPLIMDIDRATDLYNIVDVKIILWRM